MCSSLVDGEAIEEDNDEWESGDRPSNHVDRCSPTIVKDVWEPGKRWIKIDFVSTLARKGKRNKNGCKDRWSWANVIPTKIVKGKFHLILNIR